MATLFSQIYTHTHDTCIHVTKDFNAVGHSYSTHPSQTHARVDTSSLMAVEFGGLYV